VRLSVYEPYVVYVVYAVYVVYLHYCTTALVLYVVWWSVGLGLGLRRILSRHLHHTSTLLTQTLTHSLTHSLTHNAKLHNNYT
jgi:hypothetical protein